MSYQIAVVSLHTTLEEFLGPPFDIEQSLKTHKIIPLIHLTDNEGLWRFWPGISYEVIAINYLRLLKKKAKYYEPAKRRGIKDVLGFDGIIISVLVGPDEELEKLSVERYAEDLHVMGFDAATTFDDYVYKDDPRWRRWKRLGIMLERAEKLVELVSDVELIGLVKGTSAAEIGHCVRALHEMGLRRMAFPCSEIMKQSRMYSWLLKDIKLFVELTRDLNVWAWLIGINSIKWMRYFGRQVDAISGPAWAYNAARGLYYARGSWAKGRLPRCKHELCRRLVRRGFSGGYVRARHNVLSLIHI